MYQRILEAVNHPLTIQTLGGQSEITIVNDVGQIVIINSSC